MFSRKFRKFWENLREIGRKFKISRHFYESSDFFGKFKGNSWKIHRKTLEKDFQQKNP